MNEFEQKIIEERYKYYTSVRKNFTLEAEKIMNQIKDGYDPTTEEVFEIIADSNNPAEMERLKEYKLLNEIRKRAIEGAITKEDFDILTTKMGLEDYFKDLLYQEFNKQGKIK